MIITLLFCVINLWWEVFLYIHWVNQPVASYCVCFVIRAALETQEVASLDLQSPAIGSVHYCILCHLTPIKWIVQLIVLFITKLFMTNMKTCLDRSAALQHMSSQRLTRGPLADQWSLSFQWHFAECCHGSTDSIVLCIFEAVWLHLTDAVSLDYVLCGVWKCRFIFASVTV